MYEVRYSRLMYVRSSVFKVNVLRSSVFKINVCM